MRDNDDGVSQWQQGYREGILEVKKCLGRRRTSLIIIVALPRHASLKFPPTSPSHHYIPNTFTSLSGNQNSNLSPLFTICSRLRYFTFKPVS